jgi:signal transduction histidine kinase/ligand-binding sensor domain-containing protein
MAGGVNLFDPEAAAAERYLPGAVSGLVGQQVMDLALDTRGQLWTACAGGGLQRFDARARRFEAPLSLAEPAPLVRAIKATADGGLLVGTSAGLFRVSPEGIARQIALNGATETPPDIWALALGADDEIHLGLSNRGLLTIAADGRVLRHDRAIAGRLDSLPDDQVRALLYTRAGELWVGTMNGVAVRARDAQAYQHWRYDGADQATLAGNRTAALLEDRDGLLWFGSWTGGIAVHNPATRVLRNARHMSDVASSLPRNPVRSLSRDPDGSFWLGVLEGGGLVHFDRDRGVFERFVHDPTDPRSLPSNNVQSVLRRADGRLWVGTNVGVARQDPDGRFTRFQHDPNDPGSLASNSTVHLFEDSLARLWVATDDAGVSMRCAQCTDFVHYTMDPANPESIGSNNLLSIAQGPQAHIWLGTFGGGLTLLNPQTGKARRFLAQAGVAGALSHNSVTGISPAAQGGWWVATQGGGVNRLTGDPLKGAVQFAAVTKADGLGADAIGAVIEDLDGFLWISTTVGISEYDPRTGNVRNLSASEGVDRAGYFVNARYRDPDGTLFFGGLQGLVWFKPQNMRQLTKAGSVVFSDFHLFNLPVQVQSRDPLSPLARGINELDSLVLRHDQNVWSMVFSSLNYAAPESTRYSYRLEGFQDDWISSRSNFRVATYTGLPAGRYRFQVRASRDDGLTWGPETVLPLTIRAAPWRSWSAYVAYALGVALLGGLALRRVRRNLQEKQRSQRAIQSSEARLKLALWGSRDELWDLDLRTGRIFRENPNPRIAVGQAAQFESIDDYLKWAHPDDHFALRRALDEHFDGRSEFYEVSYRVRGVDTPWVWLLGRGQAVDRNSHGKATRMVGTNRDISALKEAEDQLRRLNEELEERVARRTDALRLANVELSGTLKELTDTQQKLIETEKMASLGTLVAGVAHEINTPVGIGVTAASHLHEETRRFGIAVSEHTLTHSGLLRYRDMVVEATDLILRNLERASHLIRSFKQVAVDQSSEERRLIEVGPYLNEVLFALGPKLKRTAHHITVEAEGQLSAHIYPGALYQIIVNLINNSLAHAFAPDQVGHIVIRVQRHAAELHLLYQDDGMGMDEATTRRVFEPFFTTKRGQGGSGLGMHIVYNLVTQMLRGTIKVRSAPGQGVAVEIRFPVD